MVVATGQMNTGQHQPGAHNGRLDAELRHSHDSLLNESAVAPEVVSLGTLTRNVRRDAAFLNLDVESYRAEALASLAQPLSALSFEFTPVEWEVARDGFGLYCFNAALGEDMRLLHPAPPDAATTW